MEQIIIDRLLLYLEPIVEDEFRTICQIEGYTHLYELGIMIADNGGLSLLYELYYNERQITLSQYEDLRSYYLEIFCASVTNRPEREYRMIYEIYAFKLYLYLEQNRGD